MTGLPAEFQWEYPAILKEVDRICLIAGRIFDELSMEHKDRFAVELLMQEALNNAVIHGCEEDPNKMVTFKLFISETEIQLDVSDSGPGFPWRELALKQARPEHESGRGMSIYELYADSVSFNEAGNRVTLIKNIHEGEKYARNANKT